MTILIERPQNIIVDVAPAPIVNFIIRNGRNKVTGIAIDYGFTSNHSQSFVRWSSSEHEPYGQWEEVPFDKTMQHEYENFCNFQDMD